jgi:hypothetical protein
MLWSGRGIAYMDSFSGYFWKSMNNILNYLFSARIAKRLFKTHPDDSAEDLSNLENWRNNCGKIDIYKSPENIGLTTAPLEIDEQPSTHITIVEDFIEKKRLRNYLKKWSRFFIWHSPACGKKIILGKNIFTDLKSLRIQKQFLLT